MSPHQGIVALTASLISIALTLLILTGIFRNEKKYQAGRDDEH